MRTTLKKLRGFLGVIVFYCRFVCNYSAIDHPLIDLTKKDAFHWSTEVHYEGLKEALISH